MEFVDKIYIISLKRHTIRKEIIKADLDSAGFDMNKIEWIDAIDGNDLDINESIKDGVISPVFRDPTGTFSKSIYGCSLSHKSAYERFLNTPDDMERALVLEDDAAITHTFLRLLLTKSFGYKAFKRELEEIDWDVVLLGGQTQRVEFTKSTNFVLKPAKRYPNDYAAHAYMITKNGAKKLIEGNESIQFAADVNLYTSDVKLYCTPSNYFEQKLGHIGKNHIYTLWKRFEMFLLEYNGVGEEIVSATAFGDWYNSPETQITKLVTVSKKLNVESVDWKSFTAPNGDVIEDWPNLYLKTKTNE
jgi:GR25 family glycosyltransferase involved in LPS biosynthesis